ncbi:MAG: alpha/beta hydrolase [Mesorhizobium sp.]|uniref:alpha/beta fold hydrolase n=1 Tax=unclassified Mesorhizobium TaxID=325217 RepID=UPI000FCB24F8|nr:MULTISPECIES: alpha/beta hydrolase [unclassified Mesorhizobium]RUV01904.1 alpha/beta hydrolase [Mesorhizobium sp. M6A.T.Cr.TU.017.01.1.1]RUV67293.1 alpha/beta hydrolase [Mesorhizobium sp. M5C.F.Cr.IN.023.01.1.1]RWD23312.1 MAG: alpha/beta hydrolase [Mesorhizobium sp.]TIP84389.1 MAG: alpha/beta fold hydrolase [Mesorhizobium sp.]
MSQELDRISNCVAAGPLSGPEVLGCATALGWSVNSLVAGSAQAPRPTSKTLIPERRISVGGIGSTYYETGVGRPIVLLHGASPGGISDARLSWIWQLHGLSDRFRVIALDQLQFGGTDDPTPGKYINRVGRVDHVIDFIDSLDLKQITLVGHSEGSFVAARVAIVRPDLVSKVVLLTSSAVSPPIGPEPFGDERDDAWLNAATTSYDYTGPMPSEEEYVRRGAIAHGADLYEAELEEYRRIAYRRPATRGKWEVRKRLPPEETDMSQYILLQQKYIYPYIDRLEGKTMLIWSTHDATVAPDRGWKLAKMIKNSEFHLLKAAHAIQRDQSEAVNWLIGHYSLTGGASAYL